MLPSWPDLAGYLQAQARNAGDLNALARAFRTLVEPFGIDAFACGRLHLHHRNLATFFLIDWPDKWREYYFRSGLLQHDPLLDRLEKTTDAFTWSELKRSRHLNKAGSESLSRVADHGWTEGLVVPIDICRPFAGLVSLVARRQAFSAEEKACLTLLSVHLYQCAKDLVLAQGVTIAPAGLTTREIGCLQLVARGFSDRRVGEALGIAATTAHEHVESAKKKLNAPTRSTVIATAVSLSIIRSL